MYLFRQIQIQTQTHVQTSIVRQRMIWWDCMSSASHSNYISCGLRLWAVSKTTQDMITANESILQLDPIRWIHVASLSCTLGLHWVLFQIDHDATCGRDGGKRTALIVVVVVLYSRHTQTGLSGWRWWMNELMQSFRVTSLLFPSSYDMIWYHVMWWVVRSVCCYLPYASYLKMYRMLSSLSSARLDIYFISRSSAPNRHHHPTSWSKDWLVIVMFDFIRVCCEATYTTSSTCFVFLTCWW